MKKIYFLCTGNSCRSQIAEGYGRKYLKGWEVRSAGVEMHGLNPQAVQVMQGDGIDISTQKSKLIDLDYFNSSDLIITLCGDARDKCPMVPASHEHQHWDITDPAGHDLSVFIEVREEIKKRVIQLQNK